MSYQSNDEATIAELRSIVNVLRNDIARLEQKVKFCSHRQEGMGIILGVLDCARTLRPPAGTSVDEALDQFAALAERSVVEFYGDDWAEFKSHCHAENGASN